MITLRANGRSATAVSDEELTTGSVGIPVKLILSSAYDGLAVTVCFKAGQIDAYDIYEGKKVKVPPQCMVDAGVPLLVGVYAKDAAGRVVIPTVWASAGSIKPGVEVAGASAADPTPDWAAQVQNEAVEAKIIAESVRAEADAGVYGGLGNRVTSLDATELVIGTEVKAVGVPVYVSDVSAYEAYGLTETGWYVFGSVVAKDGSTVTSETTVEGAAGYIAEVGAHSISVAVRFEVAAMAQPVTIDWGTYVDRLLFSAPDLAVRNLDYRTTFYVYDLAPFVTWEYTAATDATFAANKFYYTLGEDGTYVLAKPGSYVIGDPIPEDTYYVHSKMTVGSGLTRNVTYRLDTPVDCPSEFILPEVEDEDHGCWYEMRFMHTGSYSSVLTPSAPDVTVATQHTQAETEGINMVDLHYSAVAGHKVWRFMNTHSTFTKISSPLVSVEFRAAPTKTAYAVGEALDTTGAEIVATYADGTRKLVTPTYAPSNGAALTAEDSTLTASYTEGEVTATATTPLTITGGE